MVGTVRESHPQTHASHAPPGGFAPTPATRHRTNGGPPSGRPFPQVSGLREGTASDAARVWRGLRRRPERASTQAGPSPAPRRTHVTALPHLLRSLRSRELRRPRGQAAALPLPSRTGHECQRKAPACWPATLLRGGVLRVTTRPSGTRRRQARTRVQSPGPTGPRSTPHVDREHSAATTDRLHGRPDALAPLRGRVARRPRSPSRPPHLRTARVRDRLRAVPGARRAPVPPVVVGRAARADPAPSEVEYANLDHAASTPRWSRQGGRRHAPCGPTPPSTAATGMPPGVTSAWYEQAASEVAGFVGAREDDNVVFTRNTTDSRNLLARALPRGTEVFVFETEHHSTLLPWDGPPHGAPAGPRQRRGRAGSCSRPRWPRRPLATPLVVVAGASNVTGELWPRRASSPRSPARHGARVVVDAAQLAPHRAIDLADLGRRLRRLLRPQALRPVRRRACSPGAATGSTPARPTCAAAARPRGSRGRRDLGHGGPARHEGGSPNVIGAIALAAACAAISAHREAIEAHEAAARPAPRSRPGRHRRASRPTRSSATTTTGWRGGLHRSTGWTPRSSRRSCRPSTASACATASSARTCSSTSCSRTRGAGTRRPRCGPAWAWPTPPSTSSASWRGGRAGGQRSGLRLRARALRLGARRRPAGPERPAALVTT